VYNELYFYIGNYRLKNVNNLKLLWCFMHDDLNVTEDMERCLSSHNNSFGNLI
jgi:hypothetical protein